MSTNKDKVFKRKTGKTNSKEEKAKIKNTDESKSDAAELRYGPLPRFPGQRVFTRGILIFGVLVYIWYFSKNNKEISLAKQNELYNRRGQFVDCSEEFLEDIKQYPGCLPATCGRYVSDKVVTSQEAETLLRLAQRIMAFGGSSGGATIVDLHSGALSYKDKFINIYAQKEKQLLTPTDKMIYQLVRQKIQSAIADSFNIDSDSIHLTHPTFFSRLTSVEPKTVHDEYWHEHVDKETYESFHYTSLLYLNDYNVDFEGGRFVFLDRTSNPKKNITIEPRTGRVLMFTSGSENPHFVERVSKGTRFAITVSFTCDSSLSIKDPLEK